MDETFCLKALKVLSDTILSDVFARVFATKGGNYFSGLKIQTKGESLLLLF